MLGVLFCLGKGQKFRIFLFCANFCHQIQTTFTPFHSQDPHNCPYDPQLGIAQQVDASLQISRQHFADPLTNSPGYLDAVLLHDLYPSADENATVWQSLSTHIGQDSVQTLGLSNVDKDNLERTCNLHVHHPKIYARPLVVQNRFYQGNDYDVEVRALCKAQGITYQAFGVRANSNMLNHQSSIVSVATNVNVSREAALYGMLMNALGSVANDKASLDMQVVVGTSKTSRMPVLEEVKRVLTILNDAHWWSVAKEQQQRRTGEEVQYGECDLSTNSDIEAEAFQLARRAFLIALGTED